MTFAKFAAIVATYRPDVEVTKHNGFQEQSGVGVVFKDSHGEDYESTRWLLRQAREQHGKISLFSGKPQDRSREIAGYEELLRRFESDEYVREWEFSVPCTPPTEG